MQVERVSFLIWTKAMKPGFWILVLSFLIHVSPTAQTRTGSTEVDILETVFRYQIAHCYKGRAPRTYFLSHKGQDPSEALMSRFKNDASRIKTQSRMSR